MAQRLFEVGKGLLVNGASVLAGSGAPSGSGDTATAGIGSIYSDTTGGAVYVKKVAGAGAGNWSLVSSDHGLATEISNLQTAISAEATSRQTADNTLQSNINNLQAQISSLGNAFNYVGTVSGGADELNAYDMASLPAGGKDAGDYYKVAVAGWFKVGSNPAFHCSVGDAIVWNTSGSVDKIDETAHEIAGAAGYVSVTGSVDTGWSIDLDSSVKAKLDSGMRFEGKVWLTSVVANIPSFTPGTDAVMDNGAIVGDGQRVLFVSLANQSLCDVYTYSVSSGTFTRTSPISSVGSLVICQTGDYANTTLILTDSGWQSVPNPAEDMVVYLEDFIGAGLYWNGGNPPSFSSQNYILANDTAISAIDKLDSAIKTVSDGIDAAVAAGLSPISGDVSNIQAQINGISGFANSLRGEIRRNYSISSAGNLANGATATLINSYVDGEGIGSNAVYYNQITSGASKAQVFYRSGTNSVAFELMIVTADTGSGLSIDYTQYGLVKTGSDLNVTYDVTTATSSNPQDAGAIALAITITNNSGAALDNVRVSFSTV